MSSTDKTKDQLLKEVSQLNFRVADLECAEREHKRAEEHHRRINECLLSLGSDFDANVARITRLCGRLLGATFSLYNRLEDGLLCSLGQWNTPPDFNPQNRPDGRICDYVIQRDSLDALVIRDLPKTRFAGTDPMVLPYELMTYIGMGVKCGDEMVGSLSVVFKRDLEPKEEDIRIIEVLASAIASEENRRNAEEALRVSEERFTLAMEASRDGIWDWDVISDEVHYSPGYTAMLGYEAGEVPAHVNSWKDLIHPEDREVVLKANMDCIENRRDNFEVEFRMQAKSGQWRRILTRGKAVTRERSGQAIRMVGTHTDITSRKQAEKALQESEERFRDLVELLPEAVFETDLHLKITFANRCAFELFGYSEEDVRRGLDGFRLFDPADRDRAKANLAQRLRGGDPGIVEYRALRKDGSTFPTIFHANAIMKEGDLIGFRGVIIDVTELKRVEEEKSRLEGRYQQAQKVEAIGRLAGGVSHDLNNLLTPILGYGELLLEDFDPDDARRESVEEILCAGVQAQELLGQLLAFSRKQTLEYRPVDMNRAVTGFEKLLRRTIREDIEIGVIPSSSIRPVMADIGRIEQVIMNLAINAQDAMPDGGKLTIETNLAVFDEEDASISPDLRPGEYVLLLVSDTGCGMNNETREHLFEPFFSSKGPLSTGLGLATVYGIVKQHGGSIQVDSEPGGGTTFKVYLPVSDESPVEEKRGKRSGRDLKGSETVLLVEDNEQVRQLTVAILNRRGYTILEAKGGAEALVALDAHDGPVDLLLTDVVMPEMNGKELFEKIAGNNPGLRVLFMSGYTDDVIAHHGVLEVGVQFIHKPFTAQALAAKVREVLEQD